MFSFSNYLKKTIIAKFLHLDKMLKKKDNFEAPKKEGIMSSTRNINLICLCLTLFAVKPLVADLQSHAKYGLAPLKKEEIDHLENTVHKVIQVKPNQLGISRIKKEHPDYQEESLKLQENHFQTSKIGSSQALKQIPKTAPLPSSVDNSKLPSFPPIGDQQQLGSCVGWGSTYYQATHEVGLASGFNNKTSNLHILSPKWTYDLLNKGSDSGLSPVDAFGLLAIHGAASIRNFPYDANYTAWDLNTQDWIGAISNRLNTYTLIPGLGGDGPQNLTAIKQALTNGHILTFATFIESWNFTTIKSGVHAGETAASWMKGTNGGHFLTIVGYDDNVWIDINNNGTVDPGEQGAFLIANSWGTSWGNKGFTWIAYDAFLTHSKVTGAPGANRVAAGTYLNSSVISAVAKAPNYTPSLVAEFSISQVLRNQINIQAGISTVSQSTPSSQIVIPAFANAGGSFAFDGTHSKVQETATFAIDLTDLSLQLNPNDPKRYYLLVSDNAKGNPTKLNSFSLLDMIHSQTIPTTLPLPQSFDKGKGQLYIDYDIR